MKKQIFLIAMVITIAFLNSCYTPSETIITPGADLGVYDYATMLPVTGSAGLARMEVKVYNALSRNGFIMVGNKQAPLLANKYKKRLVEVSLSISQSGIESIVSVTFYDFTTGRLIANCTGAFGLGFSREYDLMVAADTAYSLVESLLKQSK